MTEERTAYRERTPWPGWVNAIFVTAIVVTCYPLLAGWDTELPFTSRLLIVGAIGGVAAFFRLLMGGLTVLVQDTRVFIYWGSLRLIRKVIPYSEILAVESVEYRPLREFGGWGIRGLGKRLAWTVRGNRAVSLRLEGDREFLIGSDYPLRLEERIRSTAGELLADGG